MLVIEYTASVVDSTADFSEWIDLQGFAMNFYRLVLLPMHKSRGLPKAEQWGGWTNFQIKGIMSQGSYDFVHMICLFTETYSKQKTLYFYNVLILTPNGTVLRVLDCRLLFGMHHLASAYGRGCSAARRQLYPSRQLSKLNLSVTAWLFYFLF